MMFNYRRWLVVDRKFACSLLVAAEYDYTHALLAVSFTNSLAHSLAVWLLACG